MQKNEIFRIFGTDFTSMTKEILQKSDLKSLIPSTSSSLGIKPNLVISKPAESGATTHPEIVRGIIEYLRENGFHNIVILEGCWLGENMENCFEATGFKKLCTEMNVPFIDINKRPSHSVDCGGMELIVSDAVNDIDFLINVPVLKGHCQVKMTCALKNMKGLVPNNEKRRFHAIGINNPLGHLGAGVKQDFIVVDNICGDLDFEEGGNPFVRNCIMTGLDPVLMDSYACKLMHFKPEDVPYVKISESLGIGSADLDNCIITSLNQSSFDKEFPKATKVLDVSYAVEALDACSACYGNLVPCLIKLREEGLLDKLNTKISMGQNQRGKTGKLGIGKCTSGFEKCIMGCPPDKNKIYDELKKYIIGE